MTSSPTEPADTTAPHAPDASDDTVDAPATAANTIDASSPQAADAVTPPSEAPVSAPPPRLAGGIELVGEFEDSGFKEAPYIVRRRDGQVIQLPHLLYVVAEHIDGLRHHQEISERVTKAFGRGLGADDVGFLIEKKLRPLGVVADDDGTRELAKADPLLALKFRTAVVPDGAVRAVTTVFKPLFLGPIVVAVIAGLLALDGWLFFAHGISQSLRAAIYQPAVLLALFGGVVLATAFHEIGHATACRYGGAKPGVMGVGIYVVWPAFYTDVTDAYRLDKRGRLRTDLGGVYFNAIFALVVSAVYFLTGFEAVLLLVVIQNFAILQQMLPLLRLDGYYIISDLTGVPDMFARIRPTLASLMPGRPTDPRVEELKPRARRVVTAYVLIVVPLLLFSAVTMLVHAPRVFATAYDSLGLRWNQLSSAFGAGHTAAGLGNGLQIATLVLPLAGMVATTGRIGRRVGSAAWTWSSGEPLRRAAVIGPMLAAAGAVAFLWWPNGEYKPIQPGERGTVEGAIKSLEQIPTGRPALTPQRERQLHGAPSLSDTARAASKKPAPDKQPDKRNATPGSSQSTTPEPTATTPQGSVSPPPADGTQAQPASPSDPTAGAEPATPPAEAPSAPAPTSTTP